MLVTLQKLFQESLDIVAPKYAGKNVNAIIMVSTRAGFGDYQCNNAMQLSKLHNKGKPKTEQKSPFDVASEIAANVPENDVIEKCEPVNGFINIYLKEDFIKAEIKRLLATGSPIPPEVPYKRVVVDFSSPNIAKPLHVGHLRSTIIGDTICRLYEYCLGIPEGGVDVDPVCDWAAVEKALEDEGENAKPAVIRTNHVGDWGTQFGMLIAQLKLEAPDFKEKMPDIGDLVTFYKRAKAHFDEDLEFKEEARRTVVKLQSHSPDEYAAWKKICELSRADFQVIYDMLKVSIAECGESFYNPLIPVVIKMMEDEGKAELDNGALCWFRDGKPDPDAPKSKKGQSASIPLILRKTDGGYGYDSTDMAAIYYRTQRLHADKIVYCTDHGQAPHFDLIFAAAKAMGWVEMGPDPEAVHVGFGLVKDTSGQKFKTRSGDTVGLRLLLDEAVGKVHAILKERSANRMTEEEMPEIAQKVGIAAVKYADLSSQRTKDYVFSFDRMLNLKGNTAVYLMYAYARISSIFGKAGTTKEALLETPEAIVLSEVAEERAAEVALMMHIARFQDEVVSTLKDLYPHRLCDYLYNLSVKISDFYEKCRVITDDAVMRESRLHMLLAAQLTMKKCFDILGIEPVEKL
ncbi:arginine--tRNA ligase [Carpediemonas membranifera]|uniref:arginine--tRNA ligase n=1 Tax=Carpediemonas membranifera TaxID=201153 RepID=A0A8J6AYT0_9EUKA|nr:arginine--tRNA ligase [Carpediemonas membranifera]|eukprot:KAG9394740.1 arginine--tRNA ligase [Carpediemonas membranifera]